MPVVLALAALAAVVVACAALCRLHRLRRALDAERAARRLTDGIRADDFRKLSDQLSEVMYARHVLSEAELVLDAALATHRTEGGSQ